MSCWVHTNHFRLLQKFKVRIEDPPRRRHMVFLGGAVLANIVSRNTRYSTWMTKLTIALLQRWPTSQTCGSRNRSGRSRAHERWKNWVQGRNRFRRSKYQCQNIQSLELAFARFMPTHSCGRASHGEALLRTRRRPCSSDTAGNLHNEAPACLIQLGL